MILGPLGPIPAARRRLADFGVLPREVQSYESRRQWNTNEIEAWIKDKGTTNTLCGLTLLDFARSREDACHCPVCRRISNELLEEAIPICT